MDRAELGGWFRERLEQARKLASLWRRELNAALAYRELFLGERGLNEAGRVALTDMMKFARVREDTAAIVQDRNGQTDTYRAGVLEGRRQVIDRITGALYMGPEELAELEKRAYDDGREYS